MQLLTPLIPSVLLLILCIAPMSMIAFIFKRQTSTKKSPLGIDFLRRPGQSLLSEIEECTAAILIKTVFIPIIPLTIYAILVTQFTLSPTRPGNNVIVLYLIGTLAIIFSLSTDVYKLIKKRNLLGLSHECEIAVGQELLALTTAGFKILHDFPAPGFNIDHIAIGPQGIFTIETKGRAKNKKQERENWKLQFDGTKLIFPTWTEEEPVSQAKDHCAWLEKWLANSTGEKHKTTPVLAIPGWQIDRIASANILIYDGKNPLFLAKGPILLDEKQIKSIVLQVENKCRDGAFAS